MVPLAQVPGLPPGARRAASRSERTVRAAAARLAAIDLNDGTAFVVTDLGDGADATADGVCDDGTGRCSLRAALMEANADPDRNAISFDASVQGVISPETQLPAIVGPVTLTAPVDGSGVPLVRLDGHRTVSVGLLLGCDGCIVRGLGVGNFTSAGVELIGGTNNRLLANFIGTFDGTNPAPNGTAAPGSTPLSAGVLIDGSASTQVGGDTAADGNVISGNSAYGIEATGKGTTGTVISANKIGTTASGTAGLGNALAGVLLTYPNGAPSDAPSATTVGGTTPEQRNIVSGNVGAGTVLSGAQGTRLLGNYIGVSADGKELANRGPAGVVDTNSRSTEIGSTTAGNVISGNAGVGVLLAGSTASKVLANKIGTDPSGDFAVSNAGSGVVVTNSVDAGPAHSVAIGGGGNGEGNIIAANGGNGVGINSGSTLVDVLGNRIGVPMDGPASLSNYGPGVVVFDASHNRIGRLVTPDITDLKLTPPTSCVGECNVIHNSHGPGIQILGKSNANRIGYNAIDSAGINIDLATANEADTGVSPNDLGHPNAPASDTDGGPNEAMNFPAGVTSFYHEPSPLHPEGMTTVSGYLDSPDPGTTTVDLYAFAAVSPTRFGGAGALSLGRVQPGPDGAFSLQLKGRLPLDHPFVGATASTATGSTSEMSAVCGDPDHNGTPDNDGDGLCDDWEAADAGPVTTAGIDYDGDYQRDLILPGANPNRANVYVELDFMRVEAGDKALSTAAFHAEKSVDGTPTKQMRQALQKIVSSFDQHNVSLTLDSECGALPGTPMCDPDDMLPYKKFLSDYSAPGPAHIVDQADMKNGTIGNPCDPNGPYAADPDGTAGNGLAAHFGTRKERNDPDCEAIIGARRLAYHYAIFANKILSGNTMPASEKDTDLGLGEISSNDLLVDVASNRHTAAEVAENFPNTTTTAAEYADDTAGSFMHELGHNLGLEHGGRTGFPNDGKVCKPNYFSVMNYAYVASTQESPAEGQRGPANARILRPLTYSEGTADSLNENALFETDGIPHRPDEWKLTRYHVNTNPRFASVPSPVDWNGNGRYEPDQLPPTPVSKCFWPDNKDTIPSPTSSAELTDNDDWHNLDFDLREWMETWTDSSASTASRERPVEGNADQFADSMLGVDGDSDGVTRVSDNCPVRANPDQLDSDADGTGDACTVQSLRLDPVNALPGGSSTATVTLQQKAGPYGQWVEIVVDDTSAVQAPEWVFVRPSEFSVDFPVKSLAFTGRPVQVSAGVGAQVATDDLQVTPVSGGQAYPGLSLNPSSVRDAATSTGTVRLGGDAVAADGGIEVTLSSSAPTVASVPATVTIPSGAGSATFAIHSSKVSKNVRVRITARWQRKQVERELAVLTSLPSYRVTDLGGGKLINPRFSPGDNYSRATAINESGSVVGVTAAQPNGFVYRGGGTPTALPRFGEAQPRAEITALNDSGQVAGTGTIDARTSPNCAILGTCPLNYFGLRWNTATNQAPIKLDDLGRTLTGATVTKTAGMNRNGDIVGEATRVRSIVDGLPQGSDLRRAFLYRDSAIPAGRTCCGTRDIGTLGGEHATAKAINDIGTVVGASTVQPFEPNWQPFVWDNGSMRSLGDLGGRYGEATAINNAGLIAGWSEVPKTDTNVNQPETAFTSDGTALTQLPSLGGERSRAYGVNDWNQVVGRSEGPYRNTVAAIFDAGQAVDINTLLGPDAQWDITEALDINNAGQIVGVGFLSSDRDLTTPHAVLLDPTDATPGPTVDAGPDRTTVEGSAANLTGTVTTPDPSGSVKTAWSWAPAPGAPDNPARTCTFAQPAAPSTTITCTDDGAIIATLTATDGVHAPVTSSTTVAVTNVAPKPASFRPTSTDVLVNQPVSFEASGNDDSPVDLAAGLSWSFDTGAGFGPFGAPNANTTTVKYAACGTYRVSARAKDKDGGVSAPLLAVPVNVYRGTFLSPAAGSTPTIVKSNQKLSVQITFGCPGNTTGLTPNLQLLRADGAPKPGDPNGTMRGTPTGYSFDFVVPKTTQPGELLSIRVRPLAPANSSPEMILKLQVSK